MKMEAAEALLVFHSSIKMPETFRTKRVTRLLLKANAKRGKKDKEGMKPLDWAKRRNNIDAAIEIEDFKYE